MSDEIEYLCPAIQGQTFDTYPPKESIQQNIVNKSLEFKIIIIPLHPFLDERGII
jgi:hypothetical protein